MFTALGGFPVHRGTADREALRLGEEAIRAGEALVIFPEGTRRSGPVVEPLFEGAAFVAMRAGVPIVPVGHRRLRVGHAEGAKGHPPGQGGDGRRSADPAARAGAGRAGASRRRSPS